MLHLNALSTSWVNVHQTTVLPCNGTFLWPSIKVIFRSNKQSSHIVTALTSLYPELPCNKTFLKCKWELTCTSYLFLPTRLTCWEFRGNPIGLASSCYRRRPQTFLLLVSSLHRPDRSSRVVNLLMHSSCLEYEDVTSIACFVIKFLSYSFNSFGGLFFL